MFLLLKSVPRLHSPATFQNQPGSLDLEGEAAPGTVGRGRKPLAENVWVSTCSSLTHEIRNHDTITNQVAGCREKLGPAVKGPHPPEGHILESISSRNS